MVFRVGVYVHQIGWTESNTWRRKAGQVIPFVPRRILTTTFFSIKANKPTWSVIVLSVWKHPIKLGR
ncbi:hypothetical protein EUGRSUZ_F02311 [Eucalyptus grandis]|uniref:Uncharacterized protein n=2 Tax=Eucalyptus grandis TaxID=71139 RepID=A0ACC3KHB7_EUCGR|nr:hypothetical protein EUGRSUZ_F02311 [Eucalyptus grandis]